MDSSVSRNATIRILFSLMACAVTALGQAPQPWRRVTTAAVELSLAGAATGPVEEVRYTAGGLLIRTATGRWLETTDFETWRVAEAANLTDSGSVLAPSGARAPEANARLAGTRQRPARVYALGSAVWRSDDGGLNWRNVSFHKTSGSIVGDGLRQIAVSPEDADDVTVAGARGVYRSVDGGLTWSGLNDALPNLPLRRIYTVPENGRTLRAAVQGLDGVIEWTPGEKAAWRRAAPQMSPGDPALQQTLLRQVLGDRFGERVSFAVANGEYVYFGTESGRLGVSPDLMTSWRFANANGGILALASDPADGQMAVATTQNGRILRTLNGGAIWDDITGDLPAGAVNGVAFDRAAGALYAATASGLYLTNTDLRSRAPETPWTRVDAGLPGAAVMDVKLNAPATQIYAAVEGWGVFSARAPHRRRDPKLVSAADQQPRAAAPGALMSVVGTGVKAARAGDAVVPVLASQEGEAQIQIPFNASGNQLNIALDARWNLRVQLESTAPALFLDSDGAPVLIDADSGLMLDARTGLKAGARLQVMAAGLGRVRPDWPAGVPAPLANAPRVVAPVRIFVDRQPLEPLRSTLAPGYVGLYLVEFELPTLLNAGAAELYLEAGGRESNRTRLFVEP